MATVMNKTTTAGLSPSQQDYFDRKYLRGFVTRLVHTQFGQVRPLPANNGTTAHFRRYNPAAPATTPLEEGVTPEGQELSQTEVVATIEQYGGIFYLTDKLAKTNLGRVVNDTIPIAQEQGALTIDHITRDVLNAGTNVMYAGGKTARNALTETDKLTGKDIRAAVKALKKAKAPRDKDGYYICILGPDGINDLQDDEDWKKVSEYQDKENIYKGEVKRLWGCKFVETTEAKVFEGAGNGGVDVGTALVMGADAYGVIRLDNANVRTIVKPMGSAGTEDGLDQRASVAWKVEGYVAKILEQSWLVRIESGVAA